MVSLPEDNYVCCRCHADTKIILNDEHGTTPHNQWCCPACGRQDEAMRDLPLFDDPEIAMKLLEIVG